MNASKCSCCGVDFTAKTENQRYCGMRCRERVHGRRARARKSQGILDEVHADLVAEHKCAFCGNEIPHNRAVLALRCGQVPKWCSDRCTAANKRWQKYRERGPLRSRHGTILGRLKKGERWEDRYPLDEMRIEYEMGYPKTSIAERFNIAYWQIERLAKQCGWKKRERTCLGCNAPCGQRRWCTHGCMARSLKPNNWMNLPEEVRERLQAKKNATKRANMTPEKRDKIRAYERTRMQRIRAVYKAVTELGLINNGVANAD